MDSFLKMQIDGLKKDREEFHKLTDQILNTIRDQRKTITKLKMENKMLRELYVERVGRALWYMRGFNVLADPEKINSIEDAMEIAKRQIKDEMQKLRS